MSGVPSTPMSGYSRPESSSNRTSLSHVPAVASQAFFRPMSSQRLQAQRGTRPSTTASRPDSVAEVTRSGANPSRNSVGSAFASIPDIPEQAGAGPPPGSRGTIMTLGTGAGVSPDSQGHGIDRRGTSESFRPLQYAGEPQWRNDGSVLNAEYPPSPRSEAPRSVRSAHRGRASSATTDRQNVEKPMDDLEAGHHTHESRAAARGALSHERNWQYFSGNTVFCWGGRLQNTRDRPISAATATLVILPTVLFFVFS